MFLMQEALVGAKPPHLMAFSKHLDSAARTLNKTQESFKTKAKVSPITPISTSEFINIHQAKAKHTAKYKQSRNTTILSIFTTTIKTKQKQLIQKSIFRLRNTIEKPTLSKQKAIYSIKHNP
jgi:hypothetical protein